jgi:hypothetical protein
MEDAKHNPLFPLAIHTYACILNESALMNTGASIPNASITISSNQNENLLRAITIPMVDFLFEFFNNKKTLNFSDAELQSSEDVFITTEITNVDHSRQVIDNQQQQNIKSVKFSNTNKGFLLSFCFIF